MVPVSSAITVQEFEAHTPLTLQSKAHGGDSQMPRISQSELLQYIHGCLEPYVSYLRSLSRVA